MRKFILVVTVIAVVIAVIFSIRVALKSYYASKNPKELYNSTFKVPENATRKLQFHLRKRDLVKVRMNLEGETPFDINMYVFDEIGYYKWKARQQSVPIRGYERVSSAEFEFEVQKTGTYFFVFDNTFSLLTPKRVRFTVSTMPWNIWRVFHHTRGS